MFKEIAKIISGRDRYLAELVENVGNMIYIDSYCVILKGRSIAERVAKNIIAIEEIKDKDELNQKDRIYTLEVEGLLEEEISKAFHTIRFLGNKVIHDEIEGAFETELTICRNLYKILSWYVVVYIDHNYEIKEYMEPKIIEKIREAEKQSKITMQISIDPYEWYKTKKCGQRFRGSVM